MSAARNWIKSGGGPLICVERLFAEWWLGVAVINPPDDLNEAHLSHYERACRVSGWAGMLAIRDRHALIMGDMPLHAELWQPSDQPACVVRTVYADHDDNLCDQLDALAPLDLSDAVHTGRFEVTSGELIVFDSAHPGSHLGDSHLTFDLVPGPYSVWTTEFKPDDRTHLVMHFFIRTH